MKNLLFTVSLALILGLTANAQQLSYGAKIGANLSTMNVKGEKSKTGFNGGVFGQLRIAKFAIQPEVLYSMQGANYNYDVLWDDMMIRYKGKVNTAYLSIPVMLQYHIIPGLKVEAGPQLGFLLSAKNKPDSWESKDVKKDMRAIDIAANFGLSYKLPMIPLGFYARYSLGLTDIFEKQHYEVFERDNGKNRVVQFGMFVEF